MEKDTEKFAKDFEEKKLSDDNYPYALMGLKVLGTFFKCLKVTIMYWVIGSVVGVVLKYIVGVADNIIQKAVIKAEIQGNASLDKVSGISGGATKHFALNGLIKFDVLAVLSTWVSGAFRFIGEVMVLTLVFLLLRYLYYVIRRHWSWETYVLRNDIEALRIKRRYLKQINVEKVYRELRTRVRKGKNSENAERSSKDDVEMARLKAHRKMNVFVNTRKAQHSSMLQKQYRAVFEVPSYQEAIKKLESDLKDIDGAFRRLLKGKVTFGKTETSEDFGFKVARGLVMEKNQLEDSKKKVPVRTEVAGSKVNSDSWTTIPLSVYKDRTKEIERVKKIAGERSEQTAKVLKTYFVSVSSNLTLSGILLNAKNATYHFDLPQYNPQMPEASTIEKQLASMLGEPSLTVAVSGGVDITIPLPKEAQIPLDTATVFRQAFGDGNFKITDVVAGVKGDGKPLIADFSKLPHLIIAGTTGSGKSVGINAMIHSIMLKATPDQVKFALVDPKFVEFEPYDKNPYLYAPIVTRMENAFALLTFLADDEMDRRYALFAKFRGVKTLEDFNDLIDRAKYADGLFKKNGIKTLAEYKKSSIKEVKSITLSTAKITLEQPEVLTMKKLEYIIAIIDEYADMGNMLEKKGAKIKSEMNANFQRLGQKARAAGIHVWLATQRPSVNVISGDIKANFPSRYAFRVSSSTDSDVVLDAFGAENLLGKGDGLLKDESGKLTRTQALFIDDKLGDGEFTKFLTALIDKFGEPTYVDYLQIMVDKGVVEWVEKDGVRSTTEVDIVNKKGSIFG